MFLTSFKTPDGKPVGMIAAETATGRVETVMEKCGPVAALPFLLHLIEAVAKEYPVFSPAGSCIRQAGGFILAAIHIEAPKPVPDPAKMCLGTYSPNPGPRAEGYRCCDRAGEYNGFGSDGPRLFTCPKSCSCHD
ncbi:MAG TPA: hypothetical protein VMZ71_09135 [Gemmataceae bacterium]|nr:hypothetical protein [Gemmataceae bacterium]